MKLLSLTVQHLRNLHQQHFRFHSHINLIVGRNGSGKTSLLEAIYLLSTGRSFRTHEKRALITHQQDCFTLFGKTVDEQSISLQKSIKNMTLARINYQPCLTSSELAQFLPCQIVYQDIFNIIDAGPGSRREVLDWGLFHVEPEYQKIYKTYRLALRQRNALLKQMPEYRLVHPWDLTIAELAEQLHAWRLNYIQRLQPVFINTLAQLSHLSCDISYYKGWDRRNDHLSLIDVLEKSFVSDVHRQFTQFGAHNADLVFANQSHQARQFFSRGQQKIILLALKFAQLALLDKEVLVLLDDFSAELDAEHTEKVLSYVQETPHQYFISARDNEAYLQSPLCLAAEKIELN